MKPRVLVIIGTRPEGIKLAPVVSALRERDGQVETRTALTGQHSALMDQVADVFQLRPDWDLEIMREGQDLYGVTEKCLYGLRPIVREYNPDLVIVEGDTASVFVAGLVSFYERTRVGHVEAGLRSGDKWRPWPEEIFRRLTGVVSDVHFAPTPAARDNLLREGVSPHAIHVTGNTVVDAVLAISRTAHEPGNPDLRAALQSGRRLVLVTAHRRESFGAPLRAAFSAIRRVADAFEDIVVLYPVHPNPNVRSAAEEILADHKRISLTTPLDYRDLLLALQECVLVLTDSGGIQEEAPTFGKPVLVLRELTERPEAIDAGISVLVGTDPDRIAGIASAVLDGRGWQFISALRELRREPNTAGIPLEEELASAKVLQSTMAQRVFPNPYGDGNAGERIADIIVHLLTGRERSTTDWPGWQ
jgi:UDP-N-acetylglucosamine 2-epimerase (non-hydrolysing)